MSEHTTPAHGPLQGLRVLEFAALGPAPMAAMMLADLGASVISVERPGDGAALFDPQHDILRRNREVLPLDLKQPAARAAALQLAQAADVLIEGFRPGVMERLALGPAQCQARNPRLVYGRMTGWGQHGPWAARVGHDINYLGLSGALAAIGPAGMPLPPLNLVADGGGGAMLLVCGVLAAVYAARASGRGQVVDAAMTDGSALLMSMIYSFRAMGTWAAARGSNLLDGGAPFYTTYATQDGRWLAVGAIEAPFYAALLDGLGLSADPQAQARQRADWPALRARFATIFRTRTREAWCAQFAERDACVSPVLDMDEAPLHPHNQARDTFLNLDDVLQPAPAPRFSETPAGRRARVRCRPTPCSTGALRPPPHACCWQRPRPHRQPRSRRPPYDHA